MTEDGVILSNRGVGRKKMIRKRKTWSLEDSCQDILVDKILVRWIGW